MILRSATASDLDSIATIEATVFEGQAWSRESVATELAQLEGNRSIIVADVMGELVGFVVLMVIAGTADLTRIAVEPVHRRNGLGRELVEEALNEAAIRGCDQVMLEVAADNVAAVNLYAAKGFHEVARRDRYYAGDVDAIVMKIRLAGTGEKRERSADG